MTQARVSEEDIRTKGSDRIQINNILAATSVAILSVLLGLSGRAFSPWMVIQLAAATPLLITSSLAYAKVSYRDLEECRTWDNLGWITLTLGYIMVLNSLAIMLYTSDYHVETWWFIGSSTILFVAYTALDVRLDRSRLKEKGTKLGLYLALIFMGSALPMLVDLL